MSYPTREYIPKAVREKVKNRFGGRCGYCGERPKQLHIDHVVPIARAHMQRDFDCHDVSNLMPACASCNNYKMSFDVEGFRRELQSQIARARDYSVNFRLAERFGLVQVVEKPIVFYFEKALAAPNSAKPGGNDG